MLGTIVPTSTIAMSTTSEDQTPTTVTTTAAPESLNSANQQDPFYLSYISDYLHLGTNSPIEIITSLIQVGLGFLAIIFVIMILWSGVQFLFSLGNEEKMKRARHTFVQAIVGVFIIMISLSLVTFLIEALSNATGASNIL